MTQFNDLTKGGCVFLFYLKRICLEQEDLRDGRHAITNRRAAGNQHHIPVSSTQQRHLSKSDYIEHFH